MSTAFADPRAEQRRQKSLRLVRAHYHDRGWQSPFRQYELLLARKLEGEARRVLDVGCGRRFPLARFLQQTGAEVHGIDPVAEPGDSPAGVVLKQGMAERIPYEAEIFDVVTSCSVLEHLEDPGRVFTEFCRVLKRGGCVVFLAASRYDYVSLFAAAVPNAWHGGLVRYLEGRDTEDTFATFYRANSRRQLRRLAQDHGFQVEQIEYLNQFPQLLMRWPWLCRAGIGYDRLIGRFRRLHWLRGWVLGCLAKR